MIADAEPARLAILISGRGRNLRALTQAVVDGRIAAEIVAVISNRADAEGLVFAREQGLNAISLPHIDFKDRTDFDGALGQHLREVSPDIVALAGFLRVLGDDFVREFQGRLLNIHPSLLPKYAGLKTHRRALDAGDTEHGATVHFVTPQLDGGPSVIQGRFTVLPQDDEASLAQRVMEEVELKIYPQAIAWMARGELKLADGVAKFRGNPLTHPLGLNDLENVFR